ncbi:hypothetical protein GCM10025876_23310 [Demequina litorisediminis]|uniref:Heat shock protein HtpX n=1 Tax=Demequina litorisediminis TaxID=1849022 RepID=A0ABQ6IHA5_9MICO|nr:hypothetical protein GCM10025876_23310 [Demequina litorisediminis]
MAPPSPATRWRWPARYAGERGTAARPLPADPKLENVSHMMIANPFKAEGLANLFATHPPMDQRIGRLEEMARRNGQHF